MVSATNLGFPRIGANRELKKLVENYWSGKLDRNALLTGSKNLRIEHWQLQKSKSIDHIPSNDFSLYDQVLDHILLFGASPSRYDVLTDDLSKYFAMARGHQKDDIDLSAMEMKKWFDTNYHYIVPELNETTRFNLSESPKPLNEYMEASKAGIQTRPVLIGPFTFLHLSKPTSHSATFTVWDKLKELVVVYEQLLKRFHDAGVEWVQIDEPILSFDIDSDKLGPLFQDVYTSLAAAAGNVKILVANYFGPLQSNVKILSSLPVSGIHIDLVRGKGDLDIVLQNIGSRKVLSLGVINGRNVWKADLTSCIQDVNKAVGLMGSDRVFVAPSCSLLHSPFSVAAETVMDSQILSWMSFAVEKLEEVAIITKAVNEGDSSVEDILKERDLNIKNRKESKLIHNESVTKEIAGVTSEMLKRKSPFSVRYPLQRSQLKLPLFPTTTIGSFPQTKEVRIARSKLNKKDWTRTEYDQFINAEIEKCIRLQEKIGLDILVHGEPERNDMVEFFGEHMTGYVFSANGWVQSYGSRCVKPPIIYGDVSRPSAITVSTAVYAQSLTKQVVKGMLTGPVTMLQWSFVRDDQPRSVTAFQLGLAIRKEVQDLEKAGIRVIQIDEPAIREGLPLRKNEWDQYLQWAVDSFLLCSTGVSDSTQIHSHFCYSDFNDVFESIKRLDADVITIENARSDLKVLEAFKEYGYENAVGPGIYDIHSPRIPTTQEIQARLKMISQKVKAELLWINPDCGLKTRKFEEVLGSLENMVHVARAMRSQYLH